VAESLNFLLYDHQEVFIGSNLKLKHKMKVASPILTDVDCK